MSNNRYQQLDFSDPENLPSEGMRGFQALCNLAKELGFVDPLHNGTLSDGSCIGDLMCFLEDNPGAIQAIYRWTAENYEAELEEMRPEEEYEEEERR